MDLKEVYTSTMETDYKYALAYIGNDVDLVTLSVCLHY